MNPFKNAKIVGQGVSPTDYANVSYGVTRGDLRFVMSRSELMLFNSCPSKWIRGWRDEGNDSTEWGDLLDCVVTTPDRFDSRFVIQPETYPASDKTQKAWTYQANYCKAWRDEQKAKGLTPIKLDAMLESQSAAKRINEDPVAHQFVSVSRRQVMVIADYEHESGLVVPVKGLIDLVPDAALYTRCLGDLKTARNASERAWQSAVVDRGYHLQATMYLDLYNAATGEDRNTFLHLVVENTPPFEIARNFLTVEFMEIGRNDYQVALNRYGWCLHKNEWPSYNHDGNSFPALPGWKECAPPLWLVQQAPEYKDPAWMTT